MDSGRPAKPTASLLGRTAGPSHLTGHVPMEGGAAAVDEDDDRVAAIVSGGLKRARLGQEEEEEGDAAAQGGKPAGWADRTGLTTRPARPARSGAHSPEEEELVRLSPPLLSTAHVFLTRLQPGLADGDGCGGDSPRAYGPLGQLRRRPAAHGPPALEGRRRCRHPRHGRRPSPDEHRPRARRRRRRIASHR